MSRPQELNDVTTEVSLLTGQFFLFPKTKLKYTVSVTSSRFIWGLDTPNGTCQALDFVDILGCGCMKGKNKNDQNAYITVYAYPHKKKFTSKKTLRQRKTVIYSFDSKTTFDANCADAEPWRKLINCLAKNVVITLPEQVPGLVIPVQKKLLVLVNPFSGPGRALNIFQQRVVPILAEANMTFNMVITEHAGHAYKLVQTLVLDQWYGIVIVSGDGLIYEVVNGLMQHEDWEAAIRIPLGCLPGGSGNALCGALLHSANEPYLDSCALHASILLAKHELLPMDLVAVDTASGKRLYSFLSVAWGIIADVDIESEKYRRLGPIRFTIGSIIRLVNLRKYHGRISFLPIEPYHPPQPLRRQSLKTPCPSPSVQPQVFRRSQSEFGDIASQSAANRSSQHEVISEEPVAKGNEGEGNGEVVTNGSQEDSAEAQLEKVTFQASAEVAVTNGTSKDTENGEKEIENGVKEKENAKKMSRSSPVPTPLLPPLSEPVPEDWVTVEDDFIFVAGIYQTHLSTDMLSTPMNKLDDGLIHLGFIRHQGMTRVQLLKIMLAMETGTHLGMEGMEYVPCRAFRLEPITEEGIMTVDGELIDYGPVQAQVLPSMLNVMTRKARQE